jgi:nitrite reductase/ring-hydroxylating ferredoxin subunit
LRGTGRRGAGKAASGAGFVVASTAAHVGGELSFGLGVRVNRTAWQRGPQEFRPVLDAADLQGSEMKRVNLDEVPILVARSRNDELCAIAATCTHFGGPLEQGKRDGDTVICPWHGSRFDLRTGGVLDGPAVFPQPRYEARIEEGKIEVRQAPG